MTLHPQEIAQIILKKYPSSFIPRVAIVLGSGLGGFADVLDDKVVIPYGDIPGFPQTSVKGHEGELILGYCQGVPMVCLKGRVHLYEGISPAFIKTYVRTLKCLGCDYFIATNASGSLKEEMPPGELMLICDHINFQGTNPLVGPNDDEFGPRFLPLDKAYDSEIAAQLIKAAKTCQIKLNQGVYLAVLGPTYETAAEIKAFKILGADAVGMSTVPEVLVAHHAGMKVGAIATITNFATGLTSVSHDHNEVVKVAHRASTHLTQILQQFLRQIHHG